MDIVKWSAISGIKAGSIVSELINPSKLSAGTVVTTSAPNCVLTELYIFIVTVTSEAGLTGIVSGNINEISKGSPTK